MLRTDRIDATTGSLWKGIIWYTLPLVVGTLIQACFNAVDLIVLGNMADSTAVASVGATTTIVNLFVTSMTGIAGGSKIILAHQFGAKDSRQIKKSVDTAMFTAVALGLFVTLLGILFAPAVLHLTKCPDDCMYGAVVYIRIYIAAAPAILLYNFGSAVLSASGDSQRPLYYMLISGLVNLIFNVVLCFIMPQKVVAVALATAASQIVGAVLVMRRLCLLDGDGRLELGNMHFDLASFKKIMRQGIPLTLNNAMYPLANLQIQSAINSFGSAAIAGNAACANIETIPASFTSSFYAAVTVFVGQNLGANKKERAKKAFWYSLFMVAAIVFCLDIGLYVTGRFWLSIFLPGDAEAVAYGMIRMAYIVLFQVVASVEQVFLAKIQAHDHASYTAVCSILCIFVFRIIWMTFVYPVYPTFESLMLCYMISWFLLFGCGITGYMRYCR